jgi:uncharacterized protein YdaL
VTVEVAPERHRLPAGVRLLLVGVAVALLAFVGVAADRYLETRPVVESPPGVPLTGPGRLAGLAMPAGAPGPGGNPGRRTLVLYNDGGPTPNLGHQYAIQAANLASRGGAWTMRPARLYQVGDVGGYQAVIYVGVDDRPLPPALLADLARAGGPVLWFGAGIRQLFGADADLAGRVGWSPGDGGAADVTGVQYQGRLLKRRAAGNDALVPISVADGRLAQVLGVARRADGSTLPWAVRSGSFTYVAEVPFSYAEPGDRYLAAADLILRAVAPDAPDRRRALIRLEDVGPNTDSQDLRKAVDYLSGRRAPFSIAVYPYYRDPYGAAHHGRPTGYRLIDKPKLVDTLKYATQHGGVILMHGYTHQYEDRRNPYTGTSGEDFEFYLAHVDAANNVQFDGPVPRDSENWATQRLSAGRGEFVRVGLPDPDVFEFPHYTASKASYRAVHAMFGVRYDQGSYFDGVCPNGDCGDGSAPAGEMFQQFFPYPVRDVYGSVVIPENLLSVSEAYNNNPAHSAADVVANAAAMTVVRDAVVSGFYHPYLGTKKLAEIVDGITALGYTFVSPYDVLR